MVRFIRWQRKQANRFKREEHELKTNFERWMYVLKNLSKLQDLPEALCNRVFEKLFRVAEILKMTPDERKVYDQSLKEFRDMYLIENELKKKNTELKEREAIIRKQSADLKKKDANLKNAARILLEAGVSIQKTAESTGLSVAEIEKIRSGK